MLQEETNDVWFKDGLRFSCTQCGTCCTGEPGYVWVDDDELMEISEGLGESLAEVERKYVKRVGRDRSLKEQENGACVFFETGVGCTIYGYRPAQCRTWPFWKSNIRTSETWKQTAAACPGCDQGRLYTIEQILDCSEVIDL